MSKPIRVLVLEDRAVDAEMNIRELRRAGFDPQWKRIETEEEYLSELNSLPDLILADYGLPNFDGLQAAKLLRERGLDIPFILISGTIGEEAAVEAIRHGATDYMLKDRIGRLGPAVERALEEKRLRGERRQEQEKLLASEARYRRLFEAAKDGILILDANSGAIEEVNPFLMEMLGCTSADFIGKQLWELGFFKDIASTKEAILELQKAGYIRYEDLPLKTKSGRPVWVEFVSNMYAVNGTQVIQCNIRDISERRQAELALKESEFRYHSLFENMLEGYAYCETVFEENRLLDFIYLEVNGAFGELTGLKNVVGRKVSDVIPGLREAHPELFEIYGRVAMTGKPEKLEKRLNALDLWLTVTVYSLDKEHFVAVFENITERKQTEITLEKIHLELLEASRRAGMAEVATGVLHNVGNVLNSVNVASTCISNSLRKSKSVNLTRVAELMRNHERNLSEFMTVDPQGKHLVGYISQLAIHLNDEHIAVIQELAGLQKNIEHIKEIVTMQQSFARGPGLMESLNISELVEDALKMNASGIMRHGIEVIREIELVSPVKVEKHKLLQILINLVRNAIDACIHSEREDRRMVLRVSKALDRVQIAISDNGVGIASENLTRIFAHGFTTKKDGHGFGLHSGFLAAQEMGGSLTVTSDGNGKGATFCIEIPVDLSRMPGSRKYAPDKLNEVPK